MHESSRLASVQPPIIPIIGRVIAETPGTISLGQGMVSWGPPKEALDVLAGFGSDRAHHQYGPVEGEPALIEAIAAKLESENGIRVSSDRRVFVTAGGNMAFLNAVLAICDPDDEVVLVAPFYFNHEMALVMTGARPVYVATDATYHLDPERVARALTPRTRAVVTISPNNPSGAVYSAESLRAVNELCAARGLFHIHDEAYEYFTYEGHRHSSPGARPGAAEHTISLFSLSKAYGFASWRIGYMVVPEALSDAVRKIQDTNLICAPLVSQYAAHAALSVGRDYCANRLPRLDHVRHLVASAFASRPDLYSLGPLEGAFYALLEVRSEMSPLTLAERLIREHRVAAIPGSTFGLPGCTLRISYGALDAETVETGLSRLARGLLAMLERR